jgi:hypothetical protein
LSQDVSLALKTVFPSLLGFSHAFICSIGSILICLVCWHKIKKAQRKSVSHKTTEMEKQLMISLGIQALTPNLIFLIATGLFLICFFSGNAWIGEFLRVQTKVSDIRFRHNWESYDSS